VLNQVSMGDFLRVTFILVQYSLYCKFCRRIYFVMMRYKQSNFAAAITVLTSIPEFECFRFIHIDIDIYYIFIIVLSCRVLSFLVYVYISLLTPIL
jgi:hypothetical protein